LDDEGALDELVLLHFFDAQHDESNLFDELFKGILHRNSAVDADYDLCGSIPSYLHSV
jgi:hypothetical protein